MFQFDHQIRVRYSETDRMDYVYYGEYAGYLEVARVEALRSLGFVYKTMEDDGILLPVLDYKIRFMRPARYDDLLRIDLRIPEIPAARMIFQYSIFNQDGVLLSEAETTLVFVQKEFGKPCKAPAALIQAIKKHFPSEV